MGLSEHGVRLQSCDSKREDDKLKNHQSWGCTIYSQTNPHDILFELEAPAPFDGQNLLAQGILMAEKMLLAVESSLTLGHTT